jgi:hypothetical protein
VIPLNTSIKAVYSNNRLRVGNGRGDHVHSFVILIGSEYFFMTNGRPMGTINVTEVNNVINLVSMTKGGVEGGCILKKEYKWNVYVQGGKKFFKQNNGEKRNDTLIVKVIQSEKCIHKFDFKIVDTMASVSIDFASLDFPNGRSIALEFNFGETTVKSKPFWVYEKQTYNRYKLYSIEEVQNMSPLTLNKLVVDLEEMERNKGPLVTLYISFVVNQPKSH